ncbi:MAG: SDR family oxidoreductase [Pseudomonadales bacterium]|nr:SDR family oxidoreductase [Pseudomonadales bacterium]
MKTLLITGASKGIGYQIAQQFLAAGARVINLSRSAAPNSQIENHAIDLAQPTAELALQKLIADILPEGEICLVHNAAKLVNDTVDDTTTNSFREIININLVAPHMLNQLVVPLMAPGSSIIYIGSTLSEKAVPGTYSYVVTKHAIVGMMRTTCQDLVGREIHTCCICPGFTDTEMLREHVGKDPEVLQSIAATASFGRLVQPSEIASTVSFAANNPVINGTILHANLGQIES